MTIDAFIEELRQRGVELWCEGDNLRFRAPFGTLDAGARARLGSAKAEVIAQLRTAAAACITTAPASYNQRSLWIVQQEDPGSAAYHVAFVARVLSTIDVSALRRALQVLVDRHAVLRTTYRNDDAGLTQYIAGCVEADLTLRPVHGADDASLDREVRADYARQFDLAVGPMLRCTLFTRALNDHVLLLVVHHIAADGWSLFQLLDELRALYAERTGRAAAVLARPQVEYADYVAWQSRMLAGDDGSRHAAYWRETLKPPRATLDLPADRRRPPRLSSRGASHVFTLDEALSSAARDMARTEGTTLFVVLLAVFKIMLFRLTRTADVIVGAPAFGRTAPEFASVIGDFVNTIVLRTNVDAGDSIRAILAKVRATQLGALAAQEYPFAKLVEDLLPTRDPGRGPFFDTFFILQRFDQLRELEPVLSSLGGDAVVDFGGLRLQHYPLDQQLGQFDLTMQFIDNGAALTAQFKYSTDLFDPSTIERWSKSYVEFLRQAVAGPATCIAQLPLGDGDTALLERFNKTSTALDTSSTVQRFVQRAARDPRRCAVRHRGEGLSCGDLNGRSNQLARHLRALGVGPGTLVAVCIERSLELLVVLLAIQKSGGAYVPLDPDFPADRLAYMLEDSGARVIVTTGDVASAVAVPMGVQVVDLASQRTALATLEATNLDPLGAPEDPAYVIYTSGSTGRPKGVVVSHGALSNFLGSMAREPGLEADDVLAAVTTISFDIAGLELYLPLIVGARIELVDRDTAMDGEALSKRLEECGATALQATPATWRMLVESGWRPTRPLRALCGGEALPRDLADALLERVAELWNLYGPTETTIWSTVGRVESSPAPITVGHPIANTRIYVLDEARRPTGIGVPGEIWIGGDGVAAGYHRRPELTAERFVADPFANVPGARMYRTGDLGRWDAQGRLHHLGRLDQQVKIRGYRIELGEIEAVLAAHPAVRHAVVNPWQAGPGDVRLVAYVVPAMAGAEPDAAVLRTHLGTTLPEYMIPASFVMLAKLPLTPNGKIDRKALPTPEGSARAFDAQAVAVPRTETERALAEIWSEVLQARAVGIDDNFFERGGHSLLVARVAARIRSRLGHDIGLRALFDLPTIRELARRLDGLPIGERNSDAIPMAVRPTRPPLSFAQLRLWYFHQLVPESALFNLPVVLTLTGALDLAALESSFRAVLARHEALRTILPEEGERPFQFISAEPKIGIQHAGMHADDGSASDSRLVAAIREEVGQPFDLANGALVRARLFRVRDRCHVLAVTMHHAISDGVSISVFVRDWAEFYRAAMMREPAQLPPLPIQYVDYAIWQREWLSDERLRKQLDFWRGTLEKAPPYLELPLDYPRPASQTYRGAFSQRRLDGAIRERLEVASRGANTSLFVALFSAFVHLLSRHSGQDDISVGVAVAGRGSAEVENLVGLFINTLVLRTRIDSRTSYQSLLKRVRKVALDAFEHQDLPFERLVEELQPPRDLARTPLFQVLFNMLDLGMPEKLHLPGLEVTPYEDHGAIEAQAKFDLTLYAQDRQGTLTFTAVYNADLFASERIDELLDQYLLLLDRASASPSVALIDIELATSPASRLPDPRAPLQSQWFGSIQGRFVEHARRSPDRVAVIDASTSTTYAQIHELSNKLAQHLIAEGVGREDRVAIHADRHVGLVVGLLAALKAGAAFMVLDPAYPATRRAAMLELAQPKAWIDLTNESLPEPLELWLGNRQGLVHANWHDDGSSSTGRWRHATCVDPPDASRPDDLAYLVFTSGSTGVPKAIAGTHGPLSHFFQWHQDTWNLTHNDRFSVLSGLAHDPLLRDVLGALWVGATVLMPDTRQITEPGYLAGWLRRDRATVVHLTPQMAELIFAGAADDSAAPLPDLRHVYFGGDVLTGRTVMAVRRLAPNAEIVNYYGASETPQAVGFYRLSSEDSANPAQRFPLGHGIADVQLLVLNDAGAMAAVGELGEVCVRTHYLARGYFGDPELTASRFAPYPFGGEQSVPMYRTGDLGRFRPDGEVEYHGRRDSQVKIRGFRVELGEVAAALRCHPDVAEAAATVGVVGGDECRLVGYYTTRSGAAVGGGDLQTFLRTRLPDHMVPAAFVALERLPLTPNGKLDVARLPTPTRVEEGRRTAPCTETELLVSAIWRDVLGVADLCVEDNFFELGGHSLTATRVLSRLRARTNLEIPLKALFEFPTIGSLARRIDEDAANAGNRVGSPIEELIF